MWVALLFSQVQYLSFDNQISSFEEIKNAMIAKIGKKAAEEVVNGAIFQVGLGNRISSAQLCQLLKGIN